MLHSRCWTVSAQPCHTTSPACCDDQGLYTNSQAVHTGPQLQPQQKAVQALSGEHGHTVAAFAVMLIEAGLLSLERLEQQSFAETCASEPCHISASGTGSPNTRKARYEW